MCRSPAHYIPSFFHSLVGKRNCLFRARQGTAGKTCIASRAAKTYFGLPVLSNHIAPIKHPKIEHPGRAPKPALDSCTQSSKTGKKCCTQRFGVTSVPLRPRYPSGYNRPNWHGALAVGS